MPSISKAVLPVAGLGTRFLPVTKAVPKELLPLVDRPCFAYVIAEAIEAGLTDIVLVTARGKTAMEDYFDRSPALEAQLEAAGKRELLEEVRAVSRAAKVISIRQHEPLGLGHAVLTAFPAVGNQDFAVLLPDDIIDHTPPGTPGAPPAIGQLLSAHQPGQAVVALQDVPRAHTNRYGICAGPEVGSNLIRVDQMVEKPKPEEAPSTLSIVGRYILPGEIFEILRHTPRGRGGEIQLTDAIAELCSQQRVFGLNFSGLRFDTGNPMGLLEASLHYSLKHPVYGAQARELLRHFTGSI